MARPDRVRALTESLLRWLLLPILLGLLLVAVSGSFAEHPARHLSGLAMAGLGWLLAVALARSTGGEEAANPALGWILLGSLALHLVAWGGNAQLSDDVQRYIWEGHLVLEGESPWAAAPDAPERAAQREARPELFRRVNHPSVSAAYPHLTQAANALVVAAAGATTEVLGGNEQRRGPAAMGLFYGLWSLAISWPLSRLLRRRGLSPRLLVVWAWCPLVPLEFADSAHLDSLGIFLLLAALDLFEGARSTSGEPQDESGPPGESVGVLLLAAGILVKFLPLCLLPALLRGRRAGQRMALLLLGLLALALPFLLLSGGLQGWTTGLGQYALKWESPNLLYRVVEGALTPFNSLAPGTPAEALGRILAGLILLALAVGAWRLRVEPLETGAALLAGYLLLSPTLHPWYLTWIIPFLAFLPAARARPWLWLIFCAPLLYWPLTEYQAGRGWLEPSWLWPVIVLPFAGLWWAGRRRQLLAPLLP
ncbi:MAG: glycosyltransferase 87 family protein [Planctomycetota bacterium]|nr:glycosyltransferase 87 family protein [Planctomycetota bacterium]MDP6838233.1 glycosyltransferase 87 family protein [Planctomycetota bacterium]